MTVTTFSQRYLAVFGASQFAGVNSGQVFHGPTGLEPADDVNQVFLGIDAENETVVDEGVSNSEALTATHGAGEEETQAQRQRTGVSATQATARP